MQLLNLNSIRRNNNKIPRYYQNNAVKAIIDDWGKGVKALVSMPTGTGKTFTIVHLINNVLKHGERVLFLVHRDRLMHQTINAFYDGLAPVNINDGQLLLGKIQGTKHKDYPADIMAAMVQSLSEKRLEKILSHGEISYIIIDETHHVTAKTYVRAIDHVIGACPDAKVLGVTATPFRADNISLGVVFDEIMERDKFTYIYELRKAIDDKTLSPIKAFAVETEIGIGHIGKALNGKKYEREMTALWEAGNWADLIYDGWVKETGGNLSTMAFMPTLDISKKFVKYLGDEHGIIAGHTDGNESLIYDEGLGDLRVIEREALDNMFSDGEFVLYSNFGVHTEGADFPIIECVIMGRPTNSVGLYMQMAGRGLRLSPDNPNKICYMMHVGFDGHPLANPKSLMGGIPKSKDVEKAEETLDSLEVQMICSQCMQGHMIKTAPGEYTCDKCGAVLSADAGATQVEFDIHDPLKPSGEGTFVRTLNLLGASKVAWYKDADGTFSVGLGTSTSESSGKKADRVFFVAAPGLSSEYPDEFVLYNVYRLVKSSQYIRARFGKGYFKYDYDNRGAQIITHGKDASNVFEKADALARDLSEVVLGNKNQKWRKEPCSPAQEKQLKRWGINTTGVTKGDAARILTHRFTKFHLSKIGSLEYEVKG